MSYILDALKKSEQERGHGGIPGVQTIHSSSLNYKTGKPYWPYILIAVVTLNLVAILYLVLVDDNTAEHSITAEETDRIQTTPSDNRPPAATPSVAITAAGTSATTSTTMRNVPAQEPVAAVSRPPREKEIRVHNEVTPVASPKPAPATQTDSYSYRPLPADNAEVIEYHDLPESVRQSLPVFVITAHVYSSNPSQRSIVINNNFLEEGEYFMDELILDEITHDGAIFIYRGIKFHHGVVAGWQ